MAATLDILFSGYVGERVAGTVSLIRSEDSVIVVDPGMVPDRAVILEPLRDLGIEPSDVSDVILSHHHPDHTMNIALFPAARVHDHWAIYERDLWTSRPAEGFEVANNGAVDIDPNRAAGVPSGLDGFDVNKLVQIERPVLRDRRQVGHRAPAYGSVGDPTNHSRIVIVTRVDKFGSRQRNGCHGIADRGHHHRRIATWFVAAFCGVRRIDAYERDREQSDRAEKVARFS